jgi:hypothetical protein
MAPNYFSSQRGAVSILITLFLLAIITVSAVVLSRTLSRQLSASQDVLVTERAFYAANSAFEEVLYYHYQHGENREVEGTIDYDTDVATFSGSATTTASGELCALGLGTYRNLQRKLAIGPPDCTF